MSGLSTALAGFLAMLNDAEEIKLLPAAATALANVAANPTLINLEAQGGLLFMQAAAAQPQLLQGSLAELATTVNSISAAATAKAAADLAAKQAALT
jgi:hypothetical protein